MTRLSDLTSLRERVAALTGPDREVDAAICVALQYGGPNSYGAVNVRTDPDWEGDLLFEIEKEECCNKIPNLTSSLDAITALIEQVLPGWGYENGKSAKGLGSHWARLFPGDNTNRKRTTFGVGANIPLALCLALLDALIARESKEASE